MLLTCEQVAQMIRDGIPGAEVTVADMTGTSDHFDATVVASEFVGKSLVQQHQLVYAALGDARKGPVHALKLNTKTP